MLPQGAGGAGRAGLPHGSLGDFLALMVRMLSHPQEAELLLRDSPDAAAQVPITFLVLQFALGKREHLEYICRYCGCYRTPRRRNRCCGNNLMLPGSVSLNNLLTISTTAASIQQACWYSWWHNL